MSKKKREREDNIIIIFTNKVIIYIYMYIYMADECSKSRNVRLGDMVGAIMRL